MDLEKFEQLASAIQSLVTAIGILVGGSWAYMRFVMHRENRPKIQILQVATHRLLGDQWKLIHVEATIRNIGKALVPLKLAKTLLFKVLPLQEPLMEKLEAGVEIFDENRTSNPWPQISRRIWEWAEDEAEIEPGETQVLYCEFTIPKEISTVQITTYLEDSTRDGMGWTSVSLVDLKDKPQTQGEPAMKPQSAQSRPKLLEPPIPPPKVPDPDKKG